MKNKQFRRGKTGKLWGHLYSHRIENFISKFVSFFQLHFPSVNRACSRLCIHFVMLLRFYACCCRCRIKIRVKNEQWTTKSMWKSVWLRALRQPQLFSISAADVMLFSLTLFCCRLHDTSSARNWDCNVSSHYFHSHYVAETLFSSAAADKVVSGWYIVHTLDSLLCNFSRFRSILLCEAWNRFLCTFVQLSCQSECFCVSPDQKEWLERKKK